MANGKGGGGAGVQRHSLLTSALNRFNKVLTQIINAKTGL
jgi:hypothetical protein